MTVSTRRIVRDTVRHGFTLVEFLVVVSILALLVGLSVPTIGMLRMSAGKTRCGNQLRQCAMGHIAYSLDNRGYIPLTNGGAQGGVGGGWQYNIRQYNEKDTADSTGTSGTSRSPLSTRCPSLPAAYMVSTLPQHDWQNGGYGRNSQLAANGSLNYTSCNFDGGDSLGGTWTQFRYSAVTYSAQRILLGHTDLNNTIYSDSRSYALLNPGRYNIWVVGTSQAYGGNDRDTWKSFQQIHGKEMPYAFVDGHMGILPSEHVAALYGIIDPKKSPY